MRDTKLLNFGARLFLVLAISSCATPGTPPPSIPIFHPDGIGSMQGTTEDGVRKNLLPSETKNLWCTTPKGIQDFASWCYGGSPVVIPGIVPDSTPTPTPNPFDYAWPKGLD